MCNTWKMTVVVNDTINIVLGISVLSSYVITLPPAMETMSANYLWAGIGGTARALTIASMFVTAAAYLYAYYHLRKDPSPVVTVGFVAFLVGAVAWAPLLTKNKKILTIAALSLTSLGALVLLVHTFLNYPSPLLKIAVAYVFFHVFVLDNLHWGYKFLKIYDPTIHA